MTHTCNVRGCGNWNCDETVSKAAHATLNMSDKEALDRIARIFRVAKLQDAHLSEMGTKVLLEIVRNTGRTIR